MLAIENVTKSYGPRVLYEGLSFKLNAKERAGLVARNGHGKTTLLRMIMGEESHDGGTITIPKNYRLGYVRQQIAFTRPTVLAEAMTGLPPTEADHHWKAEKILAGLGFSAADGQRPPGEFSGGYQVRLNLAKALLAEPDLLLLDEPTNYLDITAIRWIIRFLQSWPHELLLITHDRGFMDQVVTHIVGLHRGRARKLKGDTAKYYEQIARDEEVYEKTRMNDERRRREVELFISRFRAKARLANMVQSRIKTLEKMEKRDKLRPLQSLEFSFRSQPFRGRRMLTARGLTFGYGDARPLFQGLNLAVEPEDRIAVVGPNGHGKTTLLKVLAGVLPPSAGEVQFNPQVRMGFFEQTNVATLLDERTVEEEIQSADPRLERQVARNICGAMMFEGDDALKRVAVLSGGEKSRVLLGKLLATPLNLLLLDEPTNHLDLVTIQWLEETLLKTDSALVLVTHDRAVLQALATRIVELDRGHLYAFPGDYHAFLARKEAALAAEEGQAARQDRELAREEAWIRQGVKARRRRNQGRVRALERLRDERRQRREALGDVRLRLQAAEQSGKLVLVAEGVSHRWGDRWVFQDLSTVISRGDRVGIVGPNGAGKTTLLQILLGRLTPERGKVRHGTRLQVAYFDQLRAQLDEERSVADNVAEGNDRIVFNGRTRHVMGYLSDFLFTVERARQPVKALSGGEKNRLLLARLFARPANLLVLDEPTNDLDLETLELLEERLYDYDGTILVVSHDRVFLDQVATGILAFEGDGRVNEYVGGYSDWRRQRRAAEAPPPAPAPKPLRLKTPPLGPRKLTFKEQKELEALPGTIERLEAEQANIFAALGDPGIYKRLGATVPGLKARLGEIETELAAAYARWEELEGRAGG